MDGARSALIVASERYADPGLRRLGSAAADARALARVLKDPGIGGFEVRILLDEPAHVINLAVEDFFADRRPDDLLLLYFSGHGVKDSDGELYFAAQDTVLGRLGATAVAAGFVNRRMSRTRSRRVVLLLDCCYAGAFERGLVSKGGEEVGVAEQLGGRGRVVITASSAMERAREPAGQASTLSPSLSVFTSALVEGLETGEADQDSDGMVGLDELYDYVYDKVRVVAEDQTPGKWALGMEGELYIARRSRPVTVPAPLPPELAQAIANPLARIRNGAVQELVMLLHGGHPGLALAARQALERLSDDDSRTVSAAAAAVLPPRGNAPDTSAAGIYKNVSTTTSDSGNGTADNGTKVGPSPPPTVEAAPAPRPAGEPASYGPASEPSAPRRTVPPRALIIALIVAVMAITALVIEIPMLGRGKPSPETSPGKSPASTTVPSATTGSIEWTYLTGGVVDSSPAVAGGIVYVGSTDHKLYALDAITGHMRWSYLTGGAVNSRPAVAGGIVYVGSTDHKLYALDAATGHMRWSYTVGGNVGPGPTVAGGTVFAGSQDHNVYALDAVTGHVRWIRPTEGEVAAGPAEAGGILYVGSSDKLYALNAMTGSVRWTYTAGSNIGSRPVVAAGIVYADCWDHKVYALDAVTGHVHWTRTLGGAIAAGPAEAGGILYVGSADHKLYALDATTGSIRWTRALGGAIAAGPAVTAGTVYVGSADYRIYALRAAS